MRTAIILLALAGLACGASTTEPEADCEPPGTEAEWCHHLDDDAVSDSLMPLPPDSVGH